MQRFILIGFLWVSILGQVLAQDDLLSLIEEDPSTRVTLTEATFKGSRLINGHSVMTRKKGSLEFIIAHRFGRLNSGSYELFGLDNANVRFGLEYGISDVFSLGFGRNSFEKTYDGFAKFALLRQQTGQRNIPISVTGFTSMAINSLRPIDDEEIEFSERLAYTFQALIARKISKGFSLQVMPSMVHFNSVEGQIKNDLFALGIGGRIKLSQRLSLNAEYYYRFDERDVEPLQDAIAFGFDLETGGHVFQFQLTNSRSMVEKGFIRETNGSFFDGDIHFGFNITRAF